MARNCVEEPAARVDAVDLVLSLWLGEGMGASAPLPAASAGLSRSVALIVRNPAENGHGFRGKAGKIPAESGQLT